MSKQKIFIYAKFLFVIGTLFLFPSISFAQISDFEINNFDSVIRVKEDASLEVTETIDVNFNVEKHGIYRDIPVVYRDKLQNKVKINLDILSVRQDSNPATYTTTQSSNNNRIKIGDADIKIIGKHKYKITYTVDRVMLYFDNYDELYWNVTGDRWEVPIKNVTASVILPDGTEIKQQACYTGYFSSTERQCVQNVQGNIVSTKAKDFLTVAIGFEKGVVYQPTKQENAMIFLKDNWYGLITLPFIFVFFILWIRFGRDPKMKTVIAEYEPPEDIKAVHAGFFKTKTVSGQLVTAMIVQLAVDGFLKINEYFEYKNNGKEKKKRKIWLEKLDKDESSLDKIHKKLLGYLFSTKKKATMKDLEIRLNAVRVKTLNKILKKDFIEKKIFIKSGFVFRTALTVSGVLLIYTGMFTGFFIGIFSAIMFVITGFVSIFFSVFMTKKTKAGTELARKVAGFKLFMHKAERYRSEWQEKENIFFDYLPYAIAFNDVKKWEKVFKDVINSNPDWYSSQSAFHFSRFASNITSVTRTVSRATTPSGGSGGSGSSGGGFGGGGGGSW